MKKALAIVLTLTLLICACSFAVYAASASASGDTAGDIGSVVYIENSLNWKDLCIYAWDYNYDEPCGQWPGTPLSECYATINYHEIYCVQIPYGTIGFIINSGWNSQTAPFYETEDILDCGSYSVLYIEESQDDLGHYIVRDRSKEHTEPTEATTEKPEPEPGERRSQLHICNSLFWDNMYVFAWDENGYPLLNDWPGTEITETYVDGYGEDIFICPVPEDAAGIVVNNGEGVRSADITNFNTYDGYRFDGSADLMGHYVPTGCFLYDFDPVPDGPVPYKCYFYNSLDFENVYLYAWDSSGDSISGEWPGECMYYTDIDPQTGYEVYYLDLPYYAAGFVISDKGERVTEELTNVNNDGKYWLDGSVDENGNYKVSPYRGDVEPTTEPSEFNRKSTIDITDNFGWGTGYLYAWDDNGTPLLGEYPGTKITETHKNVYGENVFVCTIPENAAGIIIGNGGDAKSEDITDFCTYDGYWFDGKKNPEGAFIATGYVEYIAEQPTTSANTQPTTEDGGEAYSTKLVTNNFCWSEGYLYAWDQDGNLLCGEWPGAKINDVRTNIYGEEVFYCRIPADAVAFIVSNDCGDQTDDIVDLSYDGYWMDGTKNGLGHYITTGFYISDDPDVTVPKPDEEPTEEPGEFTPGDVNGDGVVTVADATLVQEHAAEMMTLTGNALAAADTNKDGIVTVGDATLIQMFAAEMITSFD